MFNNVKDAFSDEIFELQKAFYQDSRSDKVNLTIGVYKDDFSKSYLLKSVEAVEKHREIIPHDYLSIEGMKEFIDNLKSLIFGETSCDEIFGIQTIGGTGALSLLESFLTKFTSTNIHIPKLTWANHNNIFSKISYYPYDINNYNHDSLCQYIECTPPTSAILLNASCQNPTGNDPTKSQWQELASIVKKRNLFTIFDCAYQGFGDSVDDDVFSIRHFVSQGINCAVAYSCSKNFGLYGERTGALFVFCPDNSKAIKSQLSSTIRSTYSNPPRFGSFIVSKILSSQYLRKSWNDDIESMRLRIKLSRNLFVDKLSELGIPNFAYVKNQKGMFSLLKITNENVNDLRKIFGIYTIANGRINVSGINQNNVDYIVDSLCEILKR